MFRNDDEILPVEIDPVDPVVLPLAVQEELKLTKEVKKARAKATKRNQDREKYRKNIEVAINKIFELEDQLEEEKLNAKTEKLRRKEIQKKLSEYKIWKERVEQRRLIKLNLRALQDELTITGSSQSLARKIADVEDQKNDGTTTFDELSRGPTSQNIHAHVDSPFHWIWVAEKREILGLGLCSIEKMRRRASTYVRGDENFHYEMEAMKIEAEKAAKGLPINERYKKKFLDHVSDDEEVQVGCVVERQRPKHQVLQTHKVKKVKVVKKKKRQETRKKNIIEKSTESSTTTLYSKDSRHVDRRRGPIDGTATGTQSPLRNDSRRGSI